MYRVDPALNHVSTLPRARLDNVAFVTQALASANQFLMQMGQISTAEIAHLHALEVVPDAFLWINSPSYRMRERQIALLPGAGPEPGTTGSFPTGVL
jgi:hypothetical protein